MQSNDKNRRKRLVILREMQSRIILKTTTIPVVGMAILTVTLVFFCRRLMAEAAREEVILPSLEPLLASVICLTAAFAVTILYVGLRFSQRIAGPTYRIVQSLKEVQDGNTELRVRLRDGDFLEEIATELNRTLAVYETKLRDSGVVSAIDATPGDPTGTDPSPTETSTDETAPAEASTVDSAPSLTESPTTSSETTASNRAD